MKIAKFFLVLLIVVIVVLALALVVVWGLGLGGNKRVVEEQTSTIVPRVYTKSERAEMVAEMQKIPVRSYSLEERQALLNIKK